MLEASADLTEIRLSPAIEAAMNELREFMFEKIYHSAELEPDRKKARYVIQKLYEYFVAKPSALPDEYLQRRDHWGLETTVTDYIAGLTDVYAIHLFEELFIPANWQIR